MKESVLIPGYEKHVIEDNPHHPNGGDQRLRVYCESVGATSDGYHTFNELYEHRIVLFCALAEMANIQGLGMFWKSRKHSDGSSWDGWFIAGSDQIQGKQITYHLPDHYWDLFHGEELEQAPEFDGHTSNDVLERFKDWIKG